jgi:[ribosomal protein S5]-alanine N-acetyltransferase
VENQDQDQDRPAVSVRFVELPPHVMELLVAGDRAGAAAATGVEISEYLAGEDSAWLWRIRLKQVAEDPDSAEWFARAAVSEPDGAVVGHAGFHGPPDEAGMVEVGYSVDPTFRRRGYARAMLAELLRRCAADHRVTTVRASISPENLASLGTIAGFGFEKVGEQWDEEDGLEVLFEVKVSAGR